MTQHVKLNSLQTCLLISSTENDFCSCSGRELEQRLVKSFLLRSKFLLLSKFLIQTDTVVFFKVRDFVGFNEGQNLSFFMKSLRFIRR